MFNKKLEKFVFFDIETCGSHSSYEKFQENDPIGASIFKKKCERLGYDSIDNAYLDKVSLFPEFGRIACLSYGICKEDQQIIVSTISDNNEEELMKKIFSLFHRITVKGMIPVGWNIKNFDIPWIIRKLLIYNLKVPDCISTYEKKPWEISIFDLKEFWKAFSNLDVTFEEATYSMGIPTPKDDIDGGMVHATYWNGELDRIITYCEKDVKTMISFCNKINNIYSFLI